MFSFSFITQFCHYQCDSMKHEEFLQKMPFIVILLVSLSHSTRLGSTSINSLFSVVKTTLIYQGATDGYHIQPVTLRDYR